ncbi:tat (twin-arginine translocation) pathway signal sequence [Streptomyces sp. WAC01280]|uniref:tat (twin-arginine translocation) pathway signal sequence n=1 Tax=Streptomyces sp. WAC01280 TaxID=2487424 RepID=UPI000F781D36|nr:tat (twin-arginine translocation) pathway signal sequence [Streptomyces sp. WAC01280]RSS57342.1 tat (twin-arginine translocation) pathway signal sequence [Streptomyces sp. WAC01280]
MNSFASLALTGAPRRQIGVLIAVTAALLVAFFVVPNSLVHQGVDTGNLRAAFRSGMVGYWASGSEDFPRQLEAAVAFWFRFHLVKAGVSALLLAATVALGVVLRRQWRRAAVDRPGRFLLVPPALLVTLLVPFALVGLVANIQGATAPFASLLPLLTNGGADGELTTTLAQIRQQLADYPAGPHAPALTAMVSDLALYHAVLAAMAALVTGALAAIAVVQWRQHRATSDGRSRRAVKLGITASVLLSGVVFVVAFANTTTATHSAEALAGLFNGGW